MTDYKARLDKMEKEWETADGLGGFVPTLFAITRELLADNETLKKNLDEARQPLNKQHNDPEDCPTWHDGCNCSVETMTYNIDRAEKAEAKILKLYEGIELAANRLGTTVPGKILRVLLEGKEND